MPTLFIVLYRTCRDPILLSFQPFVRVQVTIGGGQKGGVWGWNLFEYLLSSPPKHYQ